MLRHGKGTETSPGEQLDPRRRPVRAVTTPLCRTVALSTNVFVIYGVGRLMVKRKGMEVSVSSGHQPALSMS